MAGRRVDQDLQKAISEHQRGQFALAERRYRSVLEEDPNCADAYALFGILLAQTGRLHEAIPNLEKAVELEPKAAQRRLHLADALREAGQAEEAKLQYREVVRLDPSRHPAVYGLARSTFQCGNAEEAIELFRKYVNKAPSHVEAWVNLGVACFHAGQLRESIEANRHALSLRPNLPLAHANLAEGYLAIGEPNKAIRSAQRALQLDPSDAHTEHLLASALFDTGDLAASFEAAQRAVRIDPERPEYRFAAARALQSMNRSDEAIASYESVLERVPDHPSAGLNLATLLSERGDVDRAADLFRSVGQSTDEIGAAARLKRALLVPIIPRSMHEIEQCRSAIESACEESTTKPDPIQHPESLIGPPGFLLAYHGKNNVRLHRKISDALSAACPDLKWTAPNLDRQSLDRKVRLGIISVHLRDHTVGHITEGLIRELPRDRFEVVVIRPNPSLDEIAKRIDASADSVVRVSNDICTARSEIASLGLDAIYFPDIGMEPFTYYLGFSRMAPFQFVGWGHADTTGLPEIDAYLSSAEFEPDGSENQYSERLVRLPRINAYLPTPAVPNGRFTREEFGSQTNGTLYVCAQSAFKLHPEFDSVLREILLADTTGTVRIASGAYGRWNELLTDRFHREIPDVASRIAFFPRVSADRFPSLLAAADVLIDPLHFTGGHTSYIATSVGKPVVTWNGCRMAGRMTAGLYRQVGIEGLSANNPREYVQIALRLAHDKAFARTKSEEVLDRGKALFEDRAAVEEFANWIERELRERSEGVCSDRSWPPAS